MARGRSIEERLAGLHELRGDAGSAEAMRELRAALRSKTGMVAAAAAEIVGEEAVMALADELPPAFARFAEDGIKRDPQCRAKCAIVKALIDLEHWDDEVFARGIACVQREPVWGGSEDSAAHVRGLCALGYAQLGHVDAVSIIADVLADAEHPAREAAARALGDSGRAEAVPLLRYKARIGDPEPAVMGSVYGSLLSLDFPGSLDRVVRVMEADADLLGEVAALALGETRRPEVVPHLVAFCERAVTLEPRKTGLVALALSRLDAARDHLIELVATAEAATAQAAISALAPFAHDRELATRVRAAAANHSDPAVHAAATASFEP